MIGLPTLGASTITKSKWSRSMLNCVAALGCADNSVRRPIGSRSGPGAYESAPQPGWRGGRDEPANARAGAQPQREAGGGGFFRTAAAMAAGVAGGTLLANSLGGMFGGGKSGDAQAGQDASTSHDSGHQDAIDNDPGNYDSDYHDAGVEEGDWGAGLDDIDI